ncbi:ArsR/SmtB family transcription factor [Kineosporia rhizophila]|uniref:ArsR/SmtB family transcription factor n=1 Tax=Kineosporia rhizophila TaxID=84633 RepID=UPI0022B7F5DF|nr:metalloregulator ArsR/SmtB family transcription factor [Kineosporia rhizophila]
MTNAERRRTAEASTAPEGEENVAAAAILFRTLGDPTRLLILRHLARGEHRVVDLMSHLGLAQSTVSGHLACLRDCGLVRSRAQGRASLYSLARPELLDLFHATESFLEATGERVVLHHTGHDHGLPHEHESPRPLTHRRAQRPGLELTHPAGDTHQTREPQA